MKTLMAEERLSKRARYRILYNQQICSQVHSMMVGKKQHIVGSITKITITIVMNLFILLILLVS